MGRVCIVDTIVDHFQPTNVGYGISTLRAVYAYRPPWYQVKLHMHNSVRSTFAYSKVFR